MLFERQSGELLFTYIKKALDKPSTLMPIAIAIVYSFTFMANANSPHLELFGKLKSYFAKWMPFVIQQSSFIIIPLFLICIALLVKEIASLIKNKSFDFTNPGEKLLKWWEIYVVVSIVYTAILMLIEPNFASFNQHLIDKHYGDIESASVALLGIPFTLLYFCRFVWKFLQERRLL